MSARERYAARLLNIIVGQSSWSRLYRRLRSDLGEVYSVRSVWLGLRQTGMWAVSVTVSPDRIGNVIELIQRELSGLEVQAGELEQAKAYYRGSLAVGFETNRSRAGIMAVEELAGGRFTPLEEASERASAVTADEISRLIRVLFVPTPDVTVVCAPAVR